MKVLKLVMVGVVLAIVAFAVVAKAQEPTAGKPLLALDRLSFAGGLNYRWYASPTPNAAPVPSFAKEWEVGLYGAYNLTPHLSLAGSSVYGFDNQNVQSCLGLRVRFGNTAVK